jgi:hypothetical protein
MFTEQTSERGEITSQKRGVSSGKFIMVSRSPRGSSTHPSSSASLLLTRSKMSEIGISAEAC